MMRRVVEIMSLCLVKESLADDAVDLVTDDHLTVDDLPGCPVALGPLHRQLTAFPGRGQLDFDTAKLLKVLVDEGCAYGESDLVVE